MGHTYRCQIWGRTGPKSGGELVTLFCDYCDDSVSAGIWAIQMGGKLVTLFDTYCHDGVDAVLGVDFMFYN